MFIDQITITGFKSYSTPITLRNLSSLNAITGLNGLGKSNVLDAIIFALNLESSKLLRIKKQEDLVNKNCDEATVEITFVNRNLKMNNKTSKVMDNKNSKSMNNTSRNVKFPAGYESHASLTITRSLTKSGKSKLHLNNHPITSTTLHSLLSSVGITKLSPNIVLQGHITKILDMHRNIKDFVTEAAGTKTYFLNSANALDTIAKKEEKLSSARDTLERRIGPFVKELRRERQSYVDMKVVGASRVRLLGVVGENERRLRMNEEMRMCVEIGGVIGEYLESRGEMGELARYDMKDGESVDDVESVDIEERMKRLGLVDEQIREVCELKKRLSKKKVNVCDRENVNTGRIDLLREKERILVEQLKITEMRESGIKMKGETLAEKMQEMERLRMRRIELCNKRDGMKKHVSAILTKNNLNTNKVNSNHNDDSKEYDNINYNGDSKEYDNSKQYDNNKEYDNSKDLINIGNALDIVNEQIKMHEQHYSDTKSLTQLTMVLQNIKSSLTYPLIHGVFGTVHENYTIKDNKYHNALTAVLGQRMKYIIVENERIGEEVIKGARNRINVIPLNKIYSNAKSKTSVCSKGGVNCVDLIVFDEKLRPAFEYLIGSFYVFESNEAARSVCFEESVFCVGLDGNVYDPRGIVTGGVNRGGVQGVVKQDGIAEIARIEKRIRDIEDIGERSRKVGDVKEYIGTRNMLNDIRTIDDEHRSVESKIDLLERFIKQNSNEASTDESSNVNYREELNTLRKEINRLERISEETRRREMESEGVRKRLVELEDESRTLENVKKELECVIREDEEKLRVMEIRRSKKSIYDKERRMHDEKKEMLVARMAKCKSKIKRGIKNLVDAEKSNDKSNENRRGNKENLCNNNGKKNSKYEVNDIHIPNDELIAELGEIPRKVLEMVGKDNTGILLNEGEEEKLRIELINARKDLEKLQNTNTTGMDPKNFDLLEKNEEAIKTLEEKIAKLEIDKTNIKTSIEKHTKAAEKELLKARNHINSVTGRFLREFIKDSDIKINEEYEIRVKIGNWKESLAELSGGQRSIVALCLIFAMLSYRPAPFYLFDEIDSALDLSFTQAIGEVIRKEFGGAQFLVVSLKEGMYENAECIYQVYQNEGKTGMRKIK